MQIILDTLEQSLRNCESQTGGEVELRTKCNPKQFDMLIGTLNARARNLFLCTHDELFRAMLFFFRSPRSARKSWSEAKVHMFTDFFYDGIRLRICGDSSQCIQKKVVEKHDFLLHASEFGRSVPLRVSYAIEADAEVRPGDRVTGVRFVERHCFDHKKYIRFDISKVVTVREDQFKKQIPADVSNEIEIEIVGKNPSCSSSQKHRYNAQSMLLKMMDLIYIMYNTKKNIEFAIEDVDQAKKCSSRV